VGSIGAGLNPQDASTNTNDHRGKGYADKQPFHTIIEGTHSFKPELKQRIYRNMYHDSGLMKSRSSDSSKSEA
jgi:hypothetical protein